MVLIVTKLHALLTCLLLWSVLTSCIYDHHVLTKTQMIMFVKKHMFQETELSGVSRPKHHRNEMTWTLDLLVRKSGNLTFK